MNGRERLLATFAGAPRDRCPVAPVLSLYGARLTQCPLETYYTDPGAYARGQAAVYEAFQPDLLFGPFVLAGEGKAFGAKLQYSARQAPILRRPALASVQEIPRLVPPDIDSHPDLLFVREAIRRIKAQHGAEVLVAACLLDPLALPAFLLGLDEWLRVCLFDPCARDALLDITIPFFVRWANALLEDGAEVVALPIIFASPRIITRTMLTAFILPALEKAFAQVRGPILIHHAGNPILEFTDLLQSLPQVAGFVADPRDSLEAMRRALQPGQVLLSGPDGPTLLRSQPGEIRARTRSLLLRQHNDPRFLLATTGADVDFATTQEQIRAFCEAPCEADA